MGIEAQERQNERALDKSSGKRQKEIKIYYDGADFIPLNLLTQRETA